MFLVAALTVLIWLGLMFFWHRFWAADQLLPPGIPGETPPVAAIIPARNEVATIAAVVQHIAAQTYRGRLRIIVVDDGSSDGTGAAARAVAPDIDVISAPPLPSGWSGKLWALEQGVRAAPDAELYWFTDADILHAPDMLSALVTKMRKVENISSPLGLVSVMAQLRCQSFWEQRLIPTFIYFFMLIYPFRAVNNPHSPIAGAAGGCILLDRKALQAIGGIQSYAHTLIDDCTLARKVKQAGYGLWLGFADGTRSLRSAETLMPLWQMVKRTAFTQLHRSWWLLIVALLGLALSFLAAPLLVLSYEGHQNRSALLCAASAWLLMAFSYVPTLRRYRRPAIEAFALPIVATIYMAMTIDSALAHARGEGGAWKGRTYG